MSRYRLCRLLFYTLQSSPLFSFVLQACKVQDLQSISIAFQFPVRDIYLGM